MKNLIKHIPLAIITLLLIALVGIFYFLYSSINSNNQKVAQIILDSELENNKREEVKNLNRSIETIKKDGDSLATHFAQGSDIVPFLDTVELLARKVGARAETSSVEVVKDNSGLLVKLNVLGSFNSVYKFLVLLENSPYEIEFLGIVMQKEPSTQSSSEDVQPKELNWQAIFNIKLLSFVK